MGGSCRKPDAQPSAQKPAQPDPPAEEETKSADPPSQREELRLRAKEWASMHFAPGGYLDPHPPPEPDPPPAVSVIPRDALCGGDVEAEAPPDESSPAFYTCSSELGVCDLPADGEDGVQDADDERAFAALIEAAANLSETKKPVHAIHLDLLWGTDDLSC